MEILFVLVAFVFGTGFGIFLTNKFRVSDNSSILVKENEIVRLTEALIQGKEEADKLQSKFEEVSSS